MVYSMLLTTPEKNMNEPPVAKAGRDTTIILPTDSLTFDGRASYDPDGTIKEYRWSKISGPASFVLFQREPGKATIKKLTQGIYQFELRVTDDGTLFASDTATITVQNTMPNNHEKINRTFRLKALYLHFLSKG